MANTINFILTNSAAALISKVLSGKTLNFTRMAVGDGFCYDTEVAKGYTKLVNEVLSLDITKKETQSPSSVRITSVLTNTDAQKEFYYREVGLYAQDPDTGEEVLYAYGNRNDAAEYITPAGSTIITKQLIFVIAVGDSANVTFNLNADVYATQEDTLEIQENIEQIQTNLEQVQANIQQNQADIQGVQTNLVGAQANIQQAQSDIQGIKTDLNGAQANIQQAQTNITTLQTDIEQTNTNITSLQMSKADINLANTGMITNCILEVPQRVKYELLNGVLTIKAGSVLIVPYGTEAPTLNIGDNLINTNYKIVDVQYVDNNCFYWVELLSDISYSETYTTKTPCTVAVQLARNSVGIYSLTDDKFTYTNNYVMHSSLVNVAHSFPIMLATRDTIGVRSVDQVFNGMGYIGYTVWIDKGVRGLSPNGFKSNGTLNNVEYLTEQLMFQTYTSSTTEFILGFDNKSITMNFVYYHEQNTQPALNNMIWLDTSSNKLYYSDGYELVDFTAKAVYAIVAKRTNGKIDYMIPFKPFQAVNKSTDKKWLSGLALPSDKYIDIDLGSDNTSYMAPANGWFAIKKVAGKVNGGFSFVVRNLADTEEVHRQTVICPSASDEIAFSIPVIKRQIVTVKYTAIGTTSYFRFIYAQGEVI